MRRGTKVPSHARCHFCKRGNRQSGGLTLKSNLSWDEDRWYCRDTQDCINQVPAGRPKVDDNISKEKALTSLAAQIQNKKAVA